jgi:hypothetical protein
MSNWKEVIVEGHVFYEGENGNVAKLSDGVYVAIVPATARLGPFETLEQAQQAVQENVEALRKHIDSFNDSLMVLSKATKIQ